ncbi:NUDIX hydrolase [Aquibacillus halophilus]|uniref:NUDIX hydrolase n=1 Tax=Aquibacillus halophilus TaxID=930132 RepID=UPI003B83550F
MNKHIPRHIVSVCAYVTNKQGQVLLVKTHNRSDTWELPGGQVEEGEPLDKAVKREFFEETGIKINPISVSGIYYNATSSILCVVFCANYIEGELVIQKEEIKDGKFINLNEATIDQFITRPDMKSRTLDAMNSTQSVPYETWKVRPNQLIARLE